MGRHRSARKYRRRRVEEKNENRKEGVRDTVTWHRMSPLPGHRSACIFSNSVSVFTSRFSRGVATAWRAGYQGIGRRYHLGYPSGGEWARLLKGPI